MTKKKPPTAVVKPEVGKVYFMRRVHDGKPCGIFIGKIKALTQRIVEFWPSDNVLHHTDHELIDEMQFIEPTKWPNEWEPTDD